MKIGCCAKPELAEIVKQAGFDSIELPVTGIEQMDDTQFQAFCELLHKLELPSPSFNVLFPGDLPLMTAKDEEIETYLKHALARVHTLGGHTVVFGSGKSRSRPDSLTYTEAFQRLIHVTGIIGDVAGRYGITIVIEPLNRKECNMISCLAEGAALVSAANHPNVKLLADYYHITLDNEPVTDVVRVSGVSHVHIATTEGRRIPTAPDDHICEFFKALKETGYHGIICVEGNNDNLYKDGPVSIDLLKRLWSEC